MSKRTVKCQYCEVSDTPKEDMVFEVVGKNNTKKYYHGGTCYEQFLKEKEFKAKERAELDSLVETIKEIYGVKIVPHQIFPFLNELRNGTRFFGKYDYKYKEGYSYSLIEDTYRYCIDSIEKSTRTKDFRNGFLGAFKYGLAIVCDKLAIVEKRNLAKESSKNRIDKHLEKMDDTGQEFETSYKKPQKAKTDITDFLED